MNENKMLVEAMKTMWFFMMMGGLLFVMGFLQLMYTN